jgi:hypothetical protein
VFTLHNLLSPSLASRAPHLHNEDRYRIHSDTIIDRYLYPLSYLLNPFLAIIAHGFILLLAYQGFEDGQNQAWRSTKCFGGTACTLKHVYA